MNESCQRWWSLRHLYFFLHEAEILVHLLHILESMLPLKVIVSGLPLYWLYIILVNVHISIYIYIYTFIHVLTAWTTASAKCYRRMLFRDLLLIKWLYPCICLLIRPRLRWNVSFNSYAKWQSLWNEQDHVQNTFFFFSLSEWLLKKTLIYGKYVSCVSWHVHTHTHTFKKTHISFCFSILKRERCTSTLFIIKN